MATNPRNKSGIQLVRRVDVNFSGQAMAKLTHLEVLVGIPEDETTRKNLTGDDENVTNASIAYIQDNGAPEANIPARPFMREGIANAKTAIIQQLERGLNAALRDSATGVDKAFHGAGIAAQRGIQNRIREGIPPPLSERTLKARAARGRKGAQIELERRDVGEAPSIEFATPLMDTGEMLQSVKYVVRPRSRRK